MTHWQEGTIQSAGLALHYTRTGDGSRPSLLLAHGLTDNGLCWARFAELAQDQFDVVMLDARNHGQSGSGDASLAGNVADMAAVVEQLQLGPASVVGHSVGATIATAFAAAHPDMVSKLVLEDPPWLAGNKGSKPSPKRIQGFRDYIASMAAKSQEEIVQLGITQHPAWHQDEFEHWAVAKQQVRPDTLATYELGDWRDLVPAVRCPALLVHAAGSADGMVSSETAEAVVAANSHFAAHHVPNAGHNLRREQFAGFVHVAMDFLCT